VPAQLNQHQEYSLTKMEHSGELAPSTFEHAQSIADELRAVISGGIALPSDKSYEAARHIFNGAIPHRPAVIVFCLSTLDVEAAMRVARRHGIPLSVRGGGHHWAGAALCPDGLVIDLSRMRQVFVDPHSQVATVAGGARVKDVAAAAGTHGLLASLGNCGTVGMAGLTLGGGYGPLNGLYGLAVDNLLGAEVVLADGRRVTTSPDEEPELFWAIRGGGGNFGVVTCMRIKLHETRHMLAGSIVYPWSEAQPVLRRYAAFAATMPDELGVPVALGSGPDGEPTVTLLPLWNGDKLQGERAMDYLQALGKPQVAQFGPMTYAEMLAPYDALVAEANGCYWEIRTRSLPALTPGAIDAIARAVASKTSLHSLVNWHHFHGAATRIAADATAFGVRQEHFMLEIIASWEPDGSDGAVHRQWAQDLCESLAPFSLPGGYANQLAPHNREQAREAYGSNGARLRSLKRRFDPDGVFASTIPLPD
jgi:FAD/FMN-containing dehydrogenase